MAVLTASGSREQSHGASRTWPAKRDRMGISKIDGKASSLEVSVLGRVLQSENPGAGLQGRPQGQAEEGTDLTGTSCPSPPGGRWRFKLVGSESSEKMLVFAPEKQPLRGMFQHRYLLSLRNESHMHTILKASSPGPFHDCWP